MNIAATLLGVIVAILWLFPSSGRMGIAYSLGLLLFVAWLGRASFSHRERVVTVLFGLLLLSAPGTSHGAVDQALKVVAGLLLVLTTGRHSLAILAPAAVVAVVAQSADVFLALSIGAATWRSKIHLRTEWLGLVAVMTLLIHLVVCILLMDESFARWDERGTSRWKAAALLDGGDPRVLLRAAGEALRAGFPDAGRQVRDYVSDVEGLTGRTDATWALRILSEDTDGRFNVARALFAEAAFQSKGVLDSLSAWDCELPRWLPWALFVHDHGAYRDLVPGEQVDASTFDAAVTEYVSRALASVGLEAEACTLATEQRWRTAEWSRYLVWQSTAAIMPPDSGRTIGRGSMVLPSGGRYALMRGQPARGVWPKISYHTPSRTGEFSLESELWLLVDLGTSEPCSLTLVNDLRSHFEDRNFVVGGRVDWKEPPAAIQSLDAASFLQCIWKRFASWEEDPPTGLTFVRAESTRVLAPAQWHEAYHETTGWLLPAQSWISWRAVPRGKYEMVMRGEPALGLWPVAEIVMDDAVQRTLIDSWDWNEHSVEVHADSAAVLLRLTNDYWDPSSGEDRNLWCWGFIPASDENEGRNE